MQKGVSYIIRVGVRMSAMEHDRGLPPVTEHLGQPSGEYIMRLSEMLDRGVDDPRRRRYMPPVRVVTTTGRVSGVSRIFRRCGSPPSIWEGKGMLLEPGASVLLDYGMELHGGVRLVTGRDEKRPQRLFRVELTFGESVSEALSRPDNDHAVHQSAVLLAQMGATEFGNTAFRFLLVRNVEEHPVELREISAVFLFLDSDWRGKFESDSPEWNRIWWTGAYTLELCLLDYVVDGAKRDRLVWIGDLNPEVRTACAVFGRLPIIEKTLDYAVRESPVPHYMNNMMSYSYWWVISLYDWYWAHGDLVFLRRYGDYLTELLRHLAGEVRPDGSIPRLTGVFDWSTLHDAAARLVGLYALAGRMFRCGAELAERLGDRDTAELCRRRYEAIRSTRLPDTAGKSAAAMRVAAGFADPVSVNRRILARRPLEGLSTFLGMLVLEVRSQAGDYAGAFSLARRYWGGMLKLGSTTYWEHFDWQWLRGAGRIDRLPTPGRIDVHAVCGDGCFRGHRNSLCHGWASGVTAWLSQTVLGIRFLEPGGRRLVLAPVLPREISEISGVWPTVYGDIEVDIRRISGGELRIACRKPREVEIVPAP